MVSLAIFAVLFAVAIPNLRDVSERQQVVGPSKQLLTDLEFARSEAVARGTDIMICVSNGAAACAAGGRGNWNTGWLVVIQDNNDCPEGDCVLRIANALPDAVTVTSTVDAATFNPFGEADSAAIFSISACGNEDFDHTEYGRTITLNTSGSRSMRKGSTACGS